jgi:FdhE protein
VRVPGGEHTFKDRARRLHALAAGHALGDYLSFMARVAEGQARAAHSLVASFPAADGAHVAACLAAGQPVYPAVGWVRDPLWRQALDMVLAHVSGQDAARHAVAELGAAPPARVESIADGLLSGDLEAAHPAQAPLVAAALQVYWNALASRLDSGLFQPGGPATGLCPVCGSAPVASVVRIGGAEQGLRYLHCSLCDSEWHLPRVQCSNCGATTDIDYYALEDGGDVVKAETCSHCHSYLKQMYMTKDPEVDPVADDLASLTLDLLMAERECLRNGPNLLFIPGQEHGND